MPYKLLIVLALFWARICAAGSASSASLMDRTLQAHVDGHSFPGIVAASLIHGKEEIHSYGKAGKSGLNLDAETIVEVASVTKTFTGLLLADLLREGKV